MDTFSLDRNGLVVESFPTGTTTSGGNDGLAGPMKTFEPGCTTPELCPIGTAPAVDWPGASE
jgi:hypothetical protein